MSVDIEAAIDPGPGSQMMIWGVVTAFGSRANSKMPLITAECRTYNEFASSIDQLIRELEALKAKAKIKFDEFKREDRA